MEKIYKVQMNSKGAPDFSTALEIPSSDNHDWEKYSDRLWKLAYERGKEDEKRWWSGHCAKCTDEDRPQEWVDKAISIIDDMQSEGIVDYEQAREFRMRVRMKGTDDEYDK